jgi:hypothetical protein
MSLSAYRAQNNLACCIPQIYIESPSMSHMAPRHDMYARSVSVLSLFTIVQFQNQGCAASSGDNGTCVTSAECSDRGGVASGPCANGYGVCCVCKLPHFIHSEQSPQLLLLYLSFFNPNKYPSISFNVK